MILDDYLLLSDEQALTTTAVSTNTIDLTSARDIGEGTTLSGFFNVNTALTGGTSVEFQMITADDAALTSNVRVIGSSGAVVTASLTAGASFEVKINDQLSSIGKRYLGARYVIVGTFGAGAVSGSVVQTVADSKKFYPSGFTVL